VREIAACRFTLIAEQELPAGRNRDTIQGWTDPWYPLAPRAVRAFASLLEDTLKRNETPPLQQIGERSIAIIATTFDR
jgi:hypothetical protein